jgi:hypothetical protein
MKEATFKGPIKSIQDIFKWIFTIFISDTHIGIWRNDLSLEEKNKLLKESCNVADVIHSSKLKVDKLHVVYYNDKAFVFAHYSPPPPLKMLSKKDFQRFILIEKSVMSPLYLKEIKEFFECSSACQFIDFGFSETLATMSSLLDYERCIIDSLRNSRGYGFQCFLSTTNTFLNVKLPHYKIEQPIESFSANASEIDSVCQKFHAFVLNVKNDYGLRNICNEILIGFKYFEQKAYVCAGAGDGGSSIGEVKVEPGQSDDTQRPAKMQRTSSEFSFGAPPR